MQVTKIADAKPYQAPNHVGTTTLRLHGWCFKIATAEMFAYDPDTSHFLPLPKP